MRKILLLVPLLVLLSGCSQTQSVKQFGNYGVYSLNLTTGSTQLLYGTNTFIDKISTSKYFIMFAQGTNSSSNIMRLTKDGKELSQLTQDSYLDTYPIILNNSVYYLAMPNKTLEIYTMDFNGNGPHQYYSSGVNDGDVNVVGDQVVFTANGSIWIMNVDKSNLRQLTHFSKAGVWGNLSLPFGDYDPKLSPDGKKVVFERLESDNSPNGNYDIYTINTDGTGETRLTNTGYSQGLPVWNPSGTKIAWIVSAINSTGVYKVYEMNSDGTNVRNITPGYYPSNFLIKSIVFETDNEIYFIGQWWS